MSQPINHPLQRRNAFHRVPEKPAKHLSSGFAYLLESLQVNHLSHPVPQGRTLTTPLNSSTSSHAESPGSSVPSGPSSSSTHMSNDAADSNDNPNDSAVSMKSSWVVDDYASDLDSDEEEGPILVPLHLVSPGNSNQDLSLPNCISEDENYPSPCWHCPDTHYGKCEVQRAFEELVQRYWGGNDNNGQQSQTDKGKSAVQNAAAALRAEARNNRFTQRGNDRVVALAKPVKLLRMGRREQKKAIRKWKGSKEKEVPLETEREVLDGNMNGMPVGNAQGSGVGDRDMEPKKEDKKEKSGFAKGFFGGLAGIVVGWCSGR